MVNEQVYNVLFKWADRRLSNVDKTENLEPKSKYQHLKNTNSQDMEKAEKLANHI